MVDMTPEGFQRDADAAQRASAKHDEEYARLYEGFKGTVFTHPAQQPAVIEISNAWALPEEEQTINPKPPQAKVLFPEIQKLLATEDEVEDGWL